MEESGITVKIISLLYTIKFKKTQKPASPDFFETIYQIITTLPYDHKLYQMAVKYSKRPYNIPPISILRSKKNTQIGIF
jgi:hypothetical protein